MLLRDELLAYKFKARYTKSQCVALFNPENMRPSSRCMHLMKSYEKLCKFPYWDQNGKIISEYKNGATIGYGHLISGVKVFEKYKSGISESQADILFDDDIHEYVQTVRFFIKEKITQHEFDGLVMFAFNVGIYAFKKSTVVKIINGESSKNLRDAWLSFKFSQGRINRGLINRREAEMNVFFNGVYFKK